MSGSKTRNSFFVDGLTKIEFDSLYLFNPEPQALSPPLFIKTLSITCIFLLDDGLVIDNLVFLELDVTSEPLIQLTTFFLAFTPSLLIPLLKSSFYVNVLSNCVVFRIKLIERFAYVSLAASTNTNWHAARTHAVRRGVKGVRQGSCRTALNKNTYVTMRYGSYFAV